MTQIVCFIFVSRHVCYKQSNRNAGLNLSQINKAGRETASSLLFRRWETLVKHCSTGGLWNTFQETSPNMQQCSGHSLWELRVQGSSGRRANCMLPPYLLQCFLDFVSLGCKRRILWTMTSLLPNPQVVLVKLNHIFYGINLILAFPGV